MGRGIRTIDNETGIVEVSSRTIHGRYLMRPSAKANDVILGVLGRAQRLYNVEIFAFVFLSNHFHILMRVSDAGRMSAFMGYLKSNLARELNILHRWKETFWGRRYHSGSVGEEKEFTLISRFRYILSNSCKERLVSSPLDWPGVTSARTLLAGEWTMTGTWRNRTAEHEGRGNKDHSVTKETVRLSPLPIFAENPAQQRRFIEEEIRELERETEQQNRLDDALPLGANAVTTRHPHEKPKDFVPSPAPRFFFSSMEEYTSMRSARRATVEAYQAASESFRRGEPNVVFPPGTFPPRRPFIKPEAPS